MHCALHIVGSMSDSWNMQRLYVEGTTTYFLSRMHDDINDVVFYVSRVLQR